MASKDCICGTKIQPVCTDDFEMSNCLHCRRLDPYSPCPEQGFGCGSGCDCCTVEQQKSIDAAFKK